MKRSQRGPKSPLTCTSGADDEIRTRDPHLGKVMLYQLSHVRVERTPYQVPPVERKALVVAEAAPPGLRR